MQSWSLLDSSNRSRRSRHAADSWRQRPRPAWPRLRQTSRLSSAPQQTTPKCRLGPC
ncbi:unnamed protein product [Ixodes hexagonus]